MTGRRASRVVKTVHRMKCFAGVLTRAPRPPRTTTVMCAAIVLGCATAPGCKKPPQVSFEIDVPSAVQAQTAWFEIGVFQGTRCASVDGRLTGGIPPDGTFRRLAFRATDANPPPLGDIPRDKYAFAAVARGDDCGVLAIGCADVDVDQATSIRIPLTATSAPSGACTAGAICDNARCVPATDNNNPSVGANCSLELLGAGPFADPLTAAGAIVSTPAIAATANGFLIAYREYDPFQGSARLTVLPIDNGGGALPAQTNDLTACASSTDEGDGAGLVSDGTNGLVALARPSCGSTGGIDLFAVDATGAVQTSAFTSSSGQTIVLSAAHSLARAGKETLLAFVEQSQARVGIVNGVSLAGNASLFGGSPPHVDAWVGASDKAIALLSRASTSNSPNAVDGGDTDSSADDAGAGDDGSIDSSGPPFDSGSGGSGNTLRLSFAAANASLAALPPPVEFSGNWGAVDVQGTRAIVASSGISPGRPVVYRIYDLGKADPSSIDGFTTSGDGDVLYSDVAFHQDHMFFAVERTGAISLVVFNHATTVPGFLRQLSLGDDPRVPSLTQVRDGRIAVAASDTRVAVVWTTRKQLTGNDAVGGYAVFACTTP